MSAAEEDLEAGGACVDYLALCERASGVCLELADMAAIADDCAAIQGRCTSNLALHCGDLGSSDGGVGSTDAGAGQDQDQGASPPTTVELLASQGEVRAPFTRSDGTVSQAVWTDDPMSGGRLALSFSLPAAGDYVIEARVDAPDTSANSFFIDIDSEPSSEAIWDIALTSGFEQRTVSWRGSGTPDHAEHAPRVFTLAAGAHTVIVRGREAGAPQGAPLPCALPVEHPLARGKKGARQATVSKEPQLTRRLNW